MTDRELMQQAIEAMEYADACLKKQLTTKTKHEYAQDLLMEAGTALRERLAQPEQEPVAWMYHGIRHDDTPHERPSLIWKPEYMDVMSAEKGAKATPLYAAEMVRLQQNISIVWSKEDVDDLIKEMQCPSVPEDARLIAAAPDLLEALEDMLGWQTLAPDDVVAAARASIAKARGEK